MKDSLQVFPNTSFMIFASTMSLIKVAVHSVWGTKDRYPFLTDEFRYQICQHILENARTKKIYIDTIDGYTDHLHCLYYLNSDLSISKSLQLIKGESAFWINQNKMFKNKFEWADDYFAVSVSESEIPKVREYIVKQSEHHKKITFKEEYEKFLKYFTKNHQG